MNLSVRDAKELHLLSHPDTDVAAYRELFAGIDCSGEWTPYYLRSPLAPHRAAQALDSEALVLVMLRNPINRFASAMRHHEGRIPITKTNDRLRLVYSDVTWGGMYATQLDAWERAIGGDRMMVMQYEAVLAEPQCFADEVWRRLGLDSVPLRDVSAASRTTARGEWSWPEALQETLRDIYAPEVERLTRWGIDPGLWPLADQSVKANGTDPTGAGGHAGGRSTSLGAVGV